MPEKINLKDERFVLALGFRDFSWRHHSECVVKQNIMEVEHVMEEAAHLMMVASRGWREWEGEDRIQGQV
jgi:hypothetical protein